MDIHGYKFPDEESATKAENEIRVNIGPIVHRDGPKEITIEAPEESASDAAKIAEKYGGKLKNSFLF